MLAPDSNTTHGGTRARYRAPVIETPTSAADLAARIDHTVLRPEATRNDIEQGAILAIEAGCASLCVQPDHVAFVHQMCGDRLVVCAVVGFPHGGSIAAVKAIEAASAVAHGATEIDMVVGLGPIAEGDLAHVAHEVAAVREAAPDVVLKVIVESALWSPPVLRDVCLAAIDGGADFVKTSTGYHPAGGATVDDVGVIRDAVGQRCSIKASGGVRTLADCAAMLRAGADRLGLSGTAAILAELAEPG